MSGNEMLFVVFPYAAFTLLIVVSIARWRLHQFTVSSMSSQLLESRRLFWGSIPFHWGLTLILIGHLAALIVPRSFELWNSVPLQLLLLEITGMALGLWALFGAIVLISRRVQVPRVRSVTTTMDWVVLGVILAQIVTGLLIAIGYRWGSFWGTSVFVPYVRSLLTFSPQPELVAALPVVLKLHVLSFFVFAAIFPFTRLVHIITLPLNYLTRPWQKVVRNAPEPYVYQPSADEFLTRR
ncbi:MAG: respiratory nitrate reductase subunit gamma [Acidimicrobiia bacterium]|nr:respiratory nitrate reductase subunit gamma [Acidimicrobiia bacterium]